MNGHTIGIDLGGTKVAGVRVDEAGMVVAERRAPSQAGEGAEAVAVTVAGMVRLLAAGAPGVDAVGVGVAGQVDSDRGVVRQAPNLRWHDYPLGARIQDATGLPVSVLNDVQAATYGEWQLGAARGASDVVCVFVGTGVGGGIVAGGRLLRGTSGAAGELGHTIVSLFGPVCRCGGRGCLEAYAGGWAIARRAFEAVSARPIAGRVLVEAAGGNAQKITASALAAAATTGDPLARALVAELEDALVAGLGSIVNAFNPEVLLLGGGVIESLPRLCDTARERLVLAALPVSAAAVRVDQAALAAAGAVGAAAWARARLHQ